MLTRILKSFLRSWRVLYALAGALSILALGNVLGVDPDLVAAVSVATAFTLCAMAGYHDAV